MAAVEVAAEVVSVLDLTAAADIDDTKTMTTLKRYLKREAGCPGLPAHIGDLSESREASGSNKSTMKPKRNSRN